MTGLKFRLLRRRFGIAPREIALALRVTEKTVRNWEESREVPGKAEGLMEALSLCGDEIRKTLAAIGGGVLPCPRDLNDMAFFFPRLAGMGAVVPLFESCLGEALEGTGAEAAYADREGYREWLGARGDSPRMRMRYLKELSCRSSLSQ